MKCKSVGRMQLFWVMLSCVGLLFIGLSAGQAWADGTETLGPPSISIAAGTGIVAAGTGLKDQPGTIDITIPAGATVKQVLLYWSGEFSVEDDNDVTVNGIPVTGTLIGGPTFFFQIYDVTAYRADITGLGLVNPGANTLTVDGLNYVGQTGSPFEIGNHGAGVLVIIDEGSAQSDIGVRDGVDLAFCDFPDPRKETVPQEYTFAPATEPRVANLAMFFGSTLGDDAPATRPNQIVIEVFNGTALVDTKTLVNAFQSFDGLQWDTVVEPVDIPAGADRVVVQPISGPTVDGNLCASFAWVAATLAVPPPQLCSIGDFVFEDANADGCQDDNELGIEGVTVTLIEYSSTDCTGTSVTQSDITDDNGFYEFTGLDCNKGYIVEFGDAGAIYARTTQDSDVCNDELDSDCNVDSGKTGCNIFLDPENEPNNPTIDCGYVCGGKIGDFVFLDEDVDGCQDNEPGIPMVDVTLSEDCDDPGNSVIATTSTDENGFYEFTGLCPGEYFVEFGNDLDNTQPGDCRDTPGGPNDPITDSNCGDRELQCVGLTRNNPEDPTIDCGKVPPPCPLEVEKTAEPLFIDCVTGTDGVDTGTDGDCIVMCDSGTDGLCIAETVTYTITVINPSNRIVENIMVVDEELGFMSDPFTLGPVQSKEFTLPGVCVKETTKNTVVVTVDGEICDTAMAEVTVDPICPDDSAVTAAPTIDLSDNKKVKWELTNNGPFDVFITKVVVTWPDAADEHDMLKKFKLDGDFAKDFLDGDSPTIVPLEKAFEDDADKRRLEAGKSEELEIEFEEEFDTKADRVPEDFSIYVLFDTGQVLTFNLP